MNVNVNGKPFTALPPGVLETIWEYGPSPVLRWIDSGLRQLIQFKVFHLHPGCHLAIRGRFLWLAMLSLWNGCRQRGRVETDLPFILDEWMDCSRRRMRAPRCPSSFTWRLERAWRCSRIPVVVCLPMIRGPGRVFCASPPATVIQDLAAAQQLRTLRLNLNPMLIDPSWIPTLSAALDGKRFLHGLYIGLANVCSDRATVHPGFPGTRPSDPWPRQLLTVITRLPSLRSLYLDVTKCLKRVWISSHASFPLDRKRGMPLTSCSCCDTAPSSKNWGLLCVRVTSLIETYGNCPSCHGCQRCGPWDCG